MTDALTEAHIREIEDANPAGLTSQQIVSAFEDRQVRFSEANLRRYVQLGLVPRSRRVGQKGKHQGSRGVYPVRAIRRINTIKKLMAESFTLEEIQAKLLSFKDGIETLDEAVVSLLDLFSTSIDKQPSSPARDRLLDELEQVKTLSAAMLEGVARLEKLVLSSGKGRRPRGGGAASATELL